MAVIFVPNQRAAKLSMVKKTPLIILAILLLSTTEILDIKKGALSFKCTNNVFFFEHGKTTFSPHVAINT